MAGYLPIPHDALNACCDTKEEMAVLDLYRRAHRLRWKPLRVTESSLVSKWKMGNRRIWGLLEALEALDLLKVEKGGPRTPSTVTVIDPTTVQRRGQRPRQRPGQRNEEGSTDDTEDRAGQDAGLHAGLNAATLDETREREPKPTPEEKVSESKDSDSPRLQAIQDVWDHWKQWHSLSRAKPSKGFAKHVNPRLGEGWTVEQLQAVSTWAHTSLDWWPTKQRESGNLGAENLFKEKGMQTRIEQATKRTRRDEPVFEQPTEPKAPLPPAPKPHPEASKVWEAVLEQLQGHIGHQDTEIWLRRPITPTGLTADSIELTVDNQAYLDWIAEHYAEDIQDTLGPRVLTMTLQRAPLRLVEPG